MSTVGIDIGGTQLRIAVFDAKKRMILCEKVPNDLSLTCEENMNRLLAQLDGLEERSLGVGIGCPGPLDIPAGRTCELPNLVGWDNFAIVDYVRGKTGLPTYLNNDANVAGLAEALLGAGKGYESVVFIGMSTGIGGAYVYRGELVNGAHSNAAEFWNMIVNEDGHGHKNANPGSLNEQVSGSGLARAATERLGRATSPKELFDLYYRREPEAVEIVEHAAETMGRGLANIVNTIDPDVFVIGGSVAIHNHAYVDLALEAARGYTSVPIRMEYARFGDDAGLIGASLLVREG